jgi:hypothetical protein
LKAVLPASRKVHGPPGENIMLYLLASLSQIFDYCSGLVHVMHEEGDANGHHSSLLPAIASFLSQMKYQRCHPSKNP